MTFQWQVLVDWDGDGIPETNEASRLTKLVITRGRRQQFARRGNYQRNLVGRASLTFDNYDNRYTSTNTSSPLYPDVSARREIVVSVIEGSNEYGVFRGFIDDLSITGRGDALFKCEDGWRWLQDSSVELPAQADVLTGEAIEQIVNSTAYPNIDWRIGIVGQSEIGETTRIATTGGSNWNWGTDISPGRTNIPYWYATGNAKTQIEDLAATESGFAYVSVDGTFVFMDRDDIYDATSAVTVTQAEILDNPIISSPADSTYNIIQVVARPLEKQATGQIWQYRLTPQLIRAGASLTIEASHKTAIDVITPVKTTDYTLNSQSGGGGTDLTASSTSSVVEGGSKSTVTITNTGAVDAYLTFLQLRGDELAAVDSIAVQIIDQDSIDVFGPKTLTIDTDWIQTYDEAVAYAEWLSSWLFDQRTVPAIQIEHRGSLQFGHDLGSLFRLDTDYYEFDETFLLGYIKHEWRHSAGQEVVTTWRGERVDNQNYWRVGIAGRSEIGVTTRVGY